MQPTPSLLHLHQLLHPDPYQHHLPPALGYPQHPPRHPSPPALPSNLQRPMSFCQRWDPEPPQPSEVVSCT
ncbi:hypothetical protein HanXRQr2_Chr14g0667371 [Helianthus annuus]|uniref:Uncharacterized protein n=1 Tax=Helianthus annuus TaxID=4232 RepID=A0A9K3ECW1_HELAN|nr:hypothetical protein HanXRQr2_Chr14g0667371 [Helianthus annuus]KAJ0842331.1 hypothetical protein HanPSC8_Chr14g0640431 [Helianthus annuus]